jgi:phospholipid/cholesterol/gamma-HCH transport system permease protein
MALSVKTIEFLRQTGGIGAFAGRFFKEAVKPRYEVAEFVRQCFIIGYKSLPLIGINRFYHGSRINHSTPAFIG